MVHSTLVPLGLVPNCKFWNSISCVLQKPKSPGVRKKHLKTKCVSV